MPKLNVTDYAKRRRRLGLPGSSRTAVYKAIKKGWIQQDRSGRIDADAADAAWSAMSRPRSDGQSAGSVANADGRAVGGVGGEVKAEDLNLHRARKEAALADLKELESAQLRGTLVERDVVKRAFFAVARATRDRLLGIADKLAGQLAAESGEHACRVMLDREIRDALREISQGPPE